MLWRAGRIHRSPQTLQSPTPLLWFLERTVNVDADCSGDLLVVRLHEPVSHGPGRLHVLAIGRYQIVASPVVGLGRIGLRLDHLVADADALYVHGPIVGTSTNVTLLPVDVLPAGALPLVRQHP